MRNDKKDEVTFYEKLNIPVVTPVIAKELCKLNIAAGYVPCLVGESGIGKTAIFRQIIQESGAKGTFFYLAHLEREDIGGIPFPNKNKTAFKYLVEETIAEIAKLAEPYYLVLDEWNRGPKDVMNAAFTLMEQRRFGSVTLPPNIHIGATMNPSDANYYVNEAENDPAFRRRLAWIGVQVDVISWLAWANENKIHPDVKKFIAHLPTALYDTLGQQSGKVYANPAAWERVSKLLYTLPATTPTTTKEYLLAGHIGLTNALQFSEWLINKNNLIDPETLIGNFPRVKNKIEQLANDASKKSTIIQMLESAVLWLTSTPKIPENAGDNIAALLKLLPEELTMIFLTNLADKISKNQEAGMRVQHALLASTKYREMFAKLVELQKKIASAL